MTTHTTKLIPISDACKEGCQFDRLTNTCEIHADVQGIAERTACAVCLTDAVRELERLTAALTRILKMTDSFEREPVQSMSVKRRYAVLLRDAAQQALDGE